MLRKIVKWITYAIVVPVLAPIFVFLIAERAFKCLFAIGVLSLTVLENYINGIEKGQLLRKNIEDLTEGGE